MSDLFGRRWRFTVGAITSDSIDLEFKIERTLLGKPGTCELHLYNLTPDNRKEIARSSRGTLVRVEAGYVDTGLTIIFQGDLRRADVTRDGANWITNVTAGDGEHALRTARVSRSFGPDSTIQDVVNAVATAMGVGTGNATDALAGRVLDQIGANFHEGTVLRGIASRELTRLLNSCGLTWSVQDGVLQLLQRGRALARTAVLLDADAGLVGSPSVGANRIVTAKALLMPDLVPGQQVQLRSDVVSGTYRIEKATYTGNTRAEDWFAEMDLRPVT